jgi:hypothetical protein
MQVTTKMRRLALQGAFWAVLATVAMMVLLNFVNLSNIEQLSAYDDDWNDLSAFREDLEEMGIETRSLVSSPLLLADIDDPRNTTFVIAGMERDTLSLPQFDPDGLVRFASEDGYSPSEIEAIVKFVEDGGTVIVMEDFGYAGGIADAFGLKYGGWQLYDTLYATELDYNYIWMCVQSTPCGMNGTELDLTTVATHPRWGDDAETVTHPCALIDGETMTRDEAGLCAQHWTPTSGDAGIVSFNASYRVLLNVATGIEIVPDVRGALREVHVLATTSNEATVDVNGDGEIWVGNDVTAETPDLWGQFNLSVEACVDRSCSPDDGGRILFFADGSMLINALYDYDAFNAGAYPDEEKDDLTVERLIPENDNRRLILDIIAEALDDPEKEGAAASSNAQVIFDESRHTQNVLVTEGYNTIYFLLVYFTGEGLAMAVLFIGLFLAFEMVLLRKRDPQSWRHVFSIIYYGFGDAERYDYYTKTEKIRQVLLSKVRNQNGLSREEFDALEVNELVALIGDDALASFAVKPGRYSLEETVALVKRIKAWGRA